MCRLAVLYMAMFALLVLLPSATAPVLIGPAQEALLETPGPAELAGNEAQPDNALWRVKDGKEGADSEWVVSGDPESLPLLIRYLKHKEEIVQLGALAEFAGMGAKARPAVPAILDVLRDPKSSIRVEAATALIHMNVHGDTAVGALEKELKSKDATARVRAAEAIGQLVEPAEVLVISCWGPDPPPRIARPWVGKRTLPTLIQALRDHEPKVRAQAAHTVGMLGSAAKPAAPALIALLKDEDAKVRQVVAHALKRVDRAAAATQGVK